jgi:predicted CoA-substrate-specific enzyme activase
LPNLLGIDAGSKTIKLVLLNEDGAIAFSQYRLHRSDILTTMREALREAIWRFGDVETNVCVTGSAGMRLAELFDAPYVQEVMATRHALGKLIPQADVAIELGGEDAKIIYLRDGVEQRMNGTCAGGTGGFIDLMTSLLGVKARQFNAMALGYQTIYPIASRCAVFAQADVRPLLNEGARRGDIAASILQAVVTQTIAGLSCGRPIKGTVVFLGGPFEVYSELVSRFRQTLGLSFAQTIKPSDAHLFVAKGAALLSGEGAKGAEGLDVGERLGEGQGSSQPRTFTLQSLLEILEAAPLEADGGIGRLRALFDTEEELSAFKERHARDKVRRARLMNATGDLFVGIDAGSTTVKLAVVNDRGELLYSAYEKSKGELLKTAQVMLEELYSSLPREYGGDSLVTIKHVKVCGYGEKLLLTAFAADSGVVETIAHLRAARELEPEVDFVLDIGGQDIKCLRVREGVIDDIMLNESCSSGCGALIEGFSRSLGFTKWSFSDSALTSTRPVDLGTRCTVFMTSRVRHAQKEGIAASDIAAGLAYSVVRNALYKVIGCGDPSRLGRSVVVQGGTFKSDAVLRAFELESGLEVVRPDIAELMGAYGAALLARDESVGRAGASTLLNPFELVSLRQTQSTRRCQGCANNCLLTISTFSPSEVVEQAQGGALLGRTLITGNRCDRAEALGSSARSLPNLIEYEQQLLAAYEKNDEGLRAATVGIPGILDVYETYPFWRTFFTSLGLRVIGTHQSSPELYRKGAYAVMSEGLCYPAKLAYGHALQLIEQGVDFLFMPQGGSVATAWKGVSEAGCSRTIECPVSSGCARLVAEAVAELWDPQRFMTCDIASSLPLAQQLAEMFTRTGCANFISIDAEAIQRALALAAEEQEVFYQNLAHRSSEALALLEQKDMRGIVLAGHPYHVDSGVNHGVDSLLVGLGFPVLSAAGLLALRSHGLKQSSDPNASMVGATWTQPTALYELAQMVARHERLDLVQLYSFGCGIDALSVGQTREILEGCGKPHTALKMDEIVDLAAIRIRLRSLAAVLEARGRSHACEAATSLETAAKPALSIQPSEPLFVMPALAPQYLAAVRRALNEMGHRLKLLPELSIHDIETGLRLCDNDLCHPLITVAGQVINAAADFEGAGPITVLIPQLCCGCRALELEQIVRQQLILRGIDRVVEVVGIPSRQRSLGLSPQLAAHVYEALTTVDALGEGGEGLAPRFASLPCHAQKGVASTPPQPQVGVIGTPGLLYTPALNRRLMRHIEAQGCRPQLPPLTELLLTNAPLERFAERFFRQGILDIICIQSFGCLTGHVNGRGAVKRIRKRYPEMNISFIDYDSGTSEVNQHSRLRLALAIARERTKS